MCVCVCVCARVHLCDRVCPFVSVFLSNKSSRTKHRGSTIKNRVQIVKAVNHRVNHSSFSDVIGDDCILSPHLTSEISWIRRLTVIR